MDMITGLEEIPYSIRARLTDGVWKAEEAIKILVDVQLYNRSKSGFGVDSDYIANSYSECLSFVLDGIRYSQLHVVEPSSYLSTKIINATKTYGLPSAIAGLSLLGNPIFLAGGIAIAAYNKLSGREQELLGKCLIPSEVIEHAKSKGKWLQMTRAKTITKSKDIPSIRIEKSHGYVSAASKDGDVTVRLSTEIHSEASINDLSLPRVENHTDISDVNDDTDALKTLITEKHKEYGGMKGKKERELKVIFKKQVGYLVDDELKNGCKCNHSDVAKRLEESATSIAMNVYGEKYKDIQGKMEILTRDAVREHMKTSEDYPDARKRIIGRNPVHIPPCPLPEHKKK